jgi:UDP-N-acetylmuramate-alanine ligase
MTFLEAAIQILRSTRRPLTTREITERALEAGLIDTHGKTPTRTMGAALYRALQADGELVKVGDPGNHPNHAKPGSVRWSAQQTRRNALNI